jgi:hypothetical protein
MIARDSIVIPIVSCTGVEPRSIQPVSQSEPQQLTVYPNPARSGWFVELPAKASEITLLDMTGRILKVFPKDKDTMFVSGYGLQDGIYVVHIRDRLGNTLSSHKTILER